MTFPPLSLKDKLKIYVLGVLFDSLTRIEPDFKNIMYNDENDKYKNTQNTNFGLPIKLFLNYF